MKTKNLPPLSRSKSLKTPHHQKQGGGGGAVLAFVFSGNWKPETANCFVFIYPVSWDISVQRTYSQLDLKIPMIFISQK
jgi:hypothetical protein